MNFETLSAAIDEGIGRLTLNQPEKLNPLSIKSLEEIIEATRWFDQHRVAVVIVTGAGDRAFSAGFDLRDFANNSAPDGPSGADSGRRMAQAVEDMDAVTIAAVHGHCIGGAVVLTAACDLRVAASNTVFSIPEVDLGIPLAWGGIPRLTREIGPAMTRELVMTCRPFTADEAKSMGFINRVVGREELMDEATALAHSILQRPQSIIRMTKKQVQAATEELVSTQKAWIGDELIKASGKDKQAQEAAQQYLAGKNDVTE
jgi:enoyl-CoA hydratase/carnithine racemase